VYVFYSYIGRTAANVCIERTTLQYHEHIQRWMWTLTTKLCVHRQTDTQKLWMMFAGRRHKNTFTAVQMTATSCSGVCPLPRSRSKSSQSIQLSLCSESFHRSCSFRLYAWVIVELVMSWLKDGSPSATEGVKNQLTEIICSSFLQHPCTF